MNLSVLTSLVLISARLSLSESFAYPWSLPLLLVEQNDIEHQYVSSWNENLGFFQCAMHFGYHNVY